MLRLLSAGLLALVLVLGGCAQKGASAFRDASAASREREALREIYNSLTPDEQGALAASVYLEQCVEHSESTDDMRSFDPGDDFETSVDRTARLFIKRDRTLIISVYRDACIVAVRSAAQDAGEVFVRAIGVRLNGGALTETSDGDTLYLRGRTRAGAPFTLAVQRDRWVERRGASYAVLSIGYQRFN